MEAAPDRNLALPLESVFATPLNATLEPLKQKLKPVQEVDVWAVVILVKAA